MQKQFFQQKILQFYRIYKLKVKYEQANKKIWVRDLFTETQRWAQGTSNNLVVEMRNTDRVKFFNFLRMSPEAFDLLLSIVELYIKKQNVVRVPIEPKVRLEITLRYLASGDSMTSISYLFRVGKQTVSSIISETCNALWESLKDKVFNKPTVENWKKSAKKFEERWNFKNCIGAIDGKHVNIQVKYTIHLAKRCLRYEGFNVIKRHCHTIIATVRCSLT